MSMIMNNPDNKQLIYLYDLPKDLITSVKVAKVIKDSSNYDLQEPVQFRDCKPHQLTGLPSPFQYGIIKVDTSVANQVASAIKYFNITEGNEDKWQCRALPFDRELLGANKNTTNNSLNFFVKNIPANIHAKELDELFSKAFGPVKSAKISLTVKDKSKPPTHNGYGFVCFQTAEAAKKAIDAGKLEGMDIIRFQVRDPREARKTFNNIYVKNYPVEWSKDKLNEIFAKYGQIKSLFTMTKKGKDGTEKPFAFVCYDKEGDRGYGPKCADEAVKDLHGKKVDEQHEIYVQPAIPIEERQAQVQREQTRFKNSKKKCNLFVKNFPHEYTEQQLAEIFGQYGEIESIKIIQPREDGGNQSKLGPRAFVCFKQPDSAANARSQLHQRIFEGRNLYVTNYELPEIRKKLQIEARDKADFLTQRKLTQAPIDSNLLQRPDTIQLIQQILFLIQKQMGPNRGYPNQGGYNGGNQQYNNRGPNMRQPRNNNGGYNNGPRQNSRSPVPQAQIQPLPQQIPVQAIPQQVTIRSNIQPLAHPDPAINGYNLSGFALLPAVVPNNPNYKNMVGEFIYEHVERIATEAYAPKITGMLIDLPVEEIKAFLYDYNKLLQKVNEAGLVLQQTTQQ